MTPSDVSLIVPVGGGAPGWHRAAASLGRLAPQPGEIIVVLDGANAAHAETDPGIGASIITLERQGGPARARNRGARAATRELLLFVDADVEVPTDLVATVVALFDASPEIAAAMGSYDAAPAAPGFVSQYRNLLHHYVHQSARAEASTFWAGCGAIRRRTFLELGGFDERFARPSIEDIELGGRLRRAGYAIRLAHALQVTHLKAWRLRDMLATDLWRRAVPWTELLLREGGINDLNVRVRDRVSVALAVIAPVALTGAWRSPAWLAAAGTAAAGVLALNAGFLAFLAERRGVLFAARAVPLFWTYLLVCGAGFGIGLARHWSRGWRAGNVERGIS